MAINPETQYPGKIAPSTPDYPYGAARNITVPGDGTGTPWEAALVNDLFGFQQALLSAAGIVPSGSPEKVGASQYRDALHKLTSLSFDTVADAKAAQVKAGLIVETRGYSAFNDGRGGYYLSLTPAQFGGTPDEFGDHTAASGNVLTLIPINGEYNAGQCGIKGDGTDEVLAINALEARIFATKANAFFPEGTYNVANANWPFKNPTVPPTSFKDYGGAIIRGAGKGKTIYKTTSATGADVLNLNGVKGLSFIDASVTATLTGTTGAGSNGVSIIGGGEDLYIDLDVFDVPGVDKTTYLDGGKGFTLQTGATSVLPYKNITMRGKLTNCGYGAGSDVQYEKFNAGSPTIMESVLIDVVCEDCWRGLAFGAAAAVSAVNPTDKDSNFVVNATLINCAQNVIADRWVRAKINAHIIATKTIAALFKPFAADQTVFGASIKGDYRSDIKITGRMLECDNKLIVGGTSQGAGVIGSSIGLNLDFELDSPTVNGDEVVIANFGGNTLSRSNVVLRGITDGTGKALGRTWQTPSRSPSVTYTNDTGRDIEVFIVLNSTGPGARTLTIDGVTFPVNLAGVAYASTVHSATVPDGSTYSYDGSFTTWRELR